MTPEPTRPSTNDHELSQRRVQLVLAIALVVSVACNVLAAEPSLVGRCVAAWPPVALMLVVDVLGRVPRSAGWLGRVVLVATGLVASVAGVASFSHMRAVALAAGESELVAWLFPLTVDGLAVICSVALVELSNRSQAAAPLPEPVESQSLVLADVEPGPELWPEGEPAPVVAPLLAPLPVPLVPVRF